MSSSRNFQKVKILTLNLLKTKNVVLIQCKDMYIHTYKNNTIPMYIHMYVFTLYWCNREN